LHKFFRSFRLEEQMDAERIEAAMMDGVLAVRLPKMEASRPRRNPIKGAWSDLFLALG
jgi:HSP20 family molecular chaperone IbpA